MSRPETPDSLRERAIAEVGRGFWSRLLGEMYVADSLFTDFCDRMKPRIGWTNQEKQSRIVA